MSKKIPAILGILLLLGGLVAAILMVGQQQGWLTKAGPTATPRDVKITNVKEDSFTVSWTTDTRVTGFVKYGESENTLNKTLSDDRDQLSGTADLYTTHYITLRSLKPNTNYFFKVGSGGSTYGSNGGDTSFKVTTPTTSNNKPAVDVINGKVVLASGQPAPGVIVYIDITGGAGLSALTKSTGTWTATLSNIRTADTKNFLNYDPVSAEITVVAQGADLGTATAMTTSSNDKPVPDITLGKTLDFRSATPKVANKTIEIKDNALSTKELGVTPGEVVTVINKDGVPHSITANDKSFDTSLISGGGNATFSAPLAVGDYPFGDTANAGVETLMGTLKVADEKVNTSFSDLTNAPEATLSVKLVNPETPGETVATSSPEITIQGPVGTKVTVTVRSDPQTEQVTIGADGTVSWTPPEGLEPGTHTVTLQYTDEKGVKQTITRSFVVAAAGSGLPSFTATPSATPTASVSSETRSTMPSTEAGVPATGTLTPTILILMMGIVLFFGGLVWQVAILKTKN